MTETPEPVDPMGAVGRVVAVMLAILIGVTLALYEPSSTSTAPPAPSPSEAASSNDDSDLNSVLEVLVERARDGIRRHGDFKTIAVGKGRDGSILIAEDATNVLDTSSASPEPLAPSLRALKERIERGDLQAYGWAQTVHAAGEKRPDGVFFEVASADGRLKRREMAFSYNVGGRIEFYGLEPTSRRPGAAFVEPPAAGPKTSTAPSSGTASPPPSGTATVAPSAASTPSPAGNSAPPGGSSTP